jgi:hypothetical protein
VDPLRATHFPLSSTSQFFSAIFISCLTPWIVLQFCIFFYNFIFRAWREYFRNFGILPIPANIIMNNQFIHRGLSL